MGALYRSFRATLRPGLYDVYALYADGRLMRMAAGSDQPFWLWGSGALGYRDLLSPGISLLAPGEAAPRQLIPGIGLTWPTFSPDVGRVAYAAQDVGGEWQIYIAPLDGSSEPAFDGLPVWAPDGSGLAFVSNRDGAWGLYLMQPNGEDPHEILDLGPNMPHWTMQRLSWVQ